MKRMDPDPAGIPGMNELHEKLFGHFVAARDIIVKGGSWSDIHSALCSVVESFEFCAAVEEALMCIHDYPGYERHRKEHEALSSMLRQLEKSNLTARLTPAMMGSMFALMVKHHLTQDRVYGLNQARARGRRRPRLTAPN